MPKNQVQVFSWRKSLLVGLLVAIIGAAGVWYAFDGGGVAAKPDGRPQAPPVPVTVAAVTRQDVPLLLEGIGTVQPLNIVTIRSRVDGELQKVLFTEGQEVKAGDPLAQIDPRPFQAALDQAIAKKAQDEAQLANAQRDLERYEALARKDFSSRQQSDTQKAQVAQFQAHGPGRSGFDRQCPVSNSTMRRSALPSTAGRVPPCRSGQHRPCRGRDRHRGGDADSSDLRRLHPAGERGPWRGRSHGAGCR